MGFKKSITESEKDDDDKMHPFETRGLGVGTFKCVGWSSFANPRSEMNDTAREAQNRMAGEQARNLGMQGKLGICDYCGMALMNNYIVQDSRNKRFVVGSECVVKAHDKSLGNEVEVLKKNAEREARRKKRDAEAHRKKWLATVNPATGETNSQRLEREQREREEAARREAEEKAKRTEGLRFMLPFLQNGSDWARSVADSIERGEAPRGRAVNILADIFAKSKGRRGSKGYDDAYAEFFQRTGLDPV